jgi:chromosome partitioning protein
MTSIGFLAQKGGAGKTTLAVHLAVLAGDALLVDLDPQRSAAEWWESRDADLPELAVGEARDLAGALAAAKRAWVLIDTAPHAAEDARTVAGLVDLVVIPTRPAILDLRAIRPTVEIVQRTTAKAVIVLNSCPAGRTAAEAAVTSEARQVLAAYGLPVVPLAIIQRAALAHALNDGRAVTEYEPDGKAAAELRSLWRWINGQARPNASRRAPK